MCPQGGSRVTAYINEFIIYDGRVGAALGLLVREYCTQRSLANIPSELLFAWARGLESYNPSAVSRRNPSNQQYTFPEIKAYKPEFYFENNIRANWLSSEIVTTTKSKFSSEENPLRAFEQALFMIGYDVSKN